MPVTRNLLALLRGELLFVERGGYRNRARFPWRPSFVFEDSPTCLNFRREEEGHPCSECQLMRLVPADKKNLAFPCRQIPLKPSGESVAHYYEWGTEAELEVALRDWLKSKIAELERDEESLQNSMTRGA